MAAALAQSVVIENVGGAGGSIGVGRVARASARSRASSTQQAPDGYTLSIGSGDQFVVNAAIYPLPYDVVKDFVPIALLVSGPTLKRMSRKKPAPHLMRGGNRFSEKDMRKCKSPPRPPFPPATSRS